MFEKNVVLLNIDTQELKDVELTQQFRLEEVLKKEM